MKLAEWVPNRIQSLKPYVAGKTIEEVKQQYQPKRISKLASNENRLGYSGKVQGAIANSLDILQDYPDPASGKLKKRLAELNSIDESEILVAAGSESIISILCRTFFNEGEHAVTADATFVGFFVQAGVQGVKVEKVPVTGGYGFDVEAIIKKVNSNTKMVYIANPNNPTGTYLSIEEYEYLVDRLPNHVLIVVDEAYYEFAKDIEDYPSALDRRKENVVVLRTFSKAYGLAGLRVGYAVADPELIVQMAKTKLTFEPTTLAQSAALAAIDDQSFISKSVELVTGGRKRLYSFFEEHDVKYVKSASNSVLMICDDDRQAEKFTFEMLKQGVILRQVGAFGLPDCVRITIGASEDMSHFEESFKNIYQTVF